MNKREELGKSILEPKYSICELHIGDSVQALIGRPTNNTSFSSNLRQIYHRQVH